VGCPGAATLLDSSEEVVPDRDGCSVDNTRSARPASMRVTSLGNLTGEESTAPEFACGKHASVPEGRSRLPSRAGVIVVRPLRQVRPTAGPTRTSDRAPPPWVLRRMKWNGRVDRCVPVCVAEAQLGHVRRVAFREPLRRVDLDRPVYRGQVSNVRGRSPAICE